MLIQYCVYCGKKINVLNLHSVMQLGVVILVFVVENTSVPVCFHSVVVTREIFHES